MLSVVRKIRQKFTEFRCALEDINSKLNIIRDALGRIESRQTADLPSVDIHASEFQVYSQWGEDGIIQHLLQHVKIERQIFVEFGVESYSEANTRFLLVNNNWAGLVIDGTARNIESIKRDPIYWRFNLKAVCSFITEKNINELLKTNGITGDIGLLSIDIDGNDYWIWNQIDVISPRIVIVEYNSRLGIEKSVTVPYVETFDRKTAHYSMIYYGASLRALDNLGRRKGYAFVGCNSNGVNAFFIRSDVLGELKETTVEQGYVAGKFREARSRNGSLAYMNAKEERELLDHLPWVEV
jgi:hypothetical protein